MDGPGITVTIGAVGFGVTVTYNDPDEAVTPPPDVTPPVISAIVATPAPNAATVTWTTDEAADSQVEYGTSPGVYGFATTINPALVTSHSVPVAALSSSTTYYYRVKSRDLAGNLRTSGEGSFLTPDTLGPVISSIAAGSLTETTATITWTTNEPADSQVEYGPTSAYGATSALNATPVTSHSVPLTGFTRGQLVHYRVKSRDAAGNLTTSGDSTFTTPDTTAPVISGIGQTIVGVSGSGTATITWTTDELSDSQVEYGPTTGYGTSTTLDATPRTSHSVQIAGLLDGSTLHYRVKSRDAASNLATSSDQTVVVSWIPLAAPTNVQATSDNTTATLTWDAVSGATSYRVGRSSAPGGPYTIVGTPTSATYPDTGLTPNTTYYYVVYAVNDSGPSGASTELVVFTAQSYDTVMAALAPDLYWILDDAGPTMADSSGSGHPGTASGTGVTYGVAGPLADGKTAVTLDGATSSISGGNVAKSVGLAVRSHTAWFKPDATMTAYGRVLSTEALTSGNTEGDGLQVSDPDRKVQYVRYHLTSGDYCETGVNAAPNGAWTFAAATYDGANERVYVNAVLIATNPSTISPSSHASPFLVGGATDTATGIFNRFKGSVHRVSSHPSVLSLSDIQALWNARTTIPVGGGGPSAPVAPTGVGVVSGDGRLTISWNTVPTATSYVVRYGTSTGVYTTETPLPITTNFTDLTGLLNGTTYYFVVLGVNAAGRGAQSSQSSATPSAGGAPTQTLRQQVDAIGSGGTGTIQAGTYREAIVPISVPKTIIIPNTVTIKGSDLWTSGVVTNGVAATWTKQGGNTWLSNKTVINSFSFDSRASGNPSQLIPYQVFVDGIQLPSVDQGTTPGPAQFRRTSTGQIEMGVDPTGKQVEVTVRKGWFEIQAADVVIRGSSISNRGSLMHAVPDYQRGGVNLLGINGTWHRAIVKWLRVGYCHTACIALYGGEDHQVVGCEIYNGDNVGLDMGNDFSTVIYGYTVTDCEIHHCGYLGNVSWHDGGSKVTVRGGSVAHPAVWLRNDVHHNNKALWLDTKDGGTKVGGTTLADANKFHHNGYGVHIEVNNGAQSGADSAGILFNFNKIYQNTNGSAVIIDSCRKVKCEGNFFAWNTGPDLDWHWYQGRGEIAAYIGAGPSDNRPKDNIFVVDHTNGSNGSTHAHMGMVWRDDANSSGTHGTMVSDTTNTAEGNNKFAFVQIPAGAIVIAAENPGTPRFEWPFYNQSHSLSVAAATRYFTGSTYFATAADVVSALASAGMPALPTS